MHLVLMFWSLRHKRGEAEAKRNALSIQRLLWARDKSGKATKLPALFSLSIKTSNCIVFYVKLQGHALS
jgi:hypothetical protein